MNRYTQSIASQAGSNGARWKQPEDCVRSSLLPKIEDHTVGQSHLYYDQFSAFRSFPWTDPYLEGPVTAYGAMAVIYPQLVRFASARVPLPLEPAEDMPIYVNAKQYQGILRRRQVRAKLEAQNKLLRARKPYLHESRHLHALKRARGSGGRFLDTKNLQHFKDCTPTNGPNKCGKIHHSETESIEASSATPCGSDVTSIFDGDDLFQQPEFGASSYHLYPGATWKRPHL